MKFNATKLIGFGLGGSALVLLCVGIYKSLAATSQSCRLVSPHERLSALADLIRPAEVMALAGRLGVCCADRVGRWMRLTLQYKPDKPGADEWCPPSVTLDRGGGDCDDLAIFGCSLLRAGGIQAEVRTGTLDQGNGPNGHAWVEGHDNRGWFLLEATSGAVHRCRPSGYLALT